MSGPRSVEPFLAPSFAPVVVSFDVDGHPAPKGSVVRFGAGRYVESSPRLADWMHAVMVAATRERIRLGRSLSGALHLDVEFRLPMPKSRPKRARDLAASGIRVPHRTRPDADKLLRAVGDALTRSKLIGDDGQIATGTFAKYEAVERVGATVDLWEIRS